MTKPHKPIVSVDFDGVLHSYDSGWKGASVIPDPPVPGAIDGLMKLLDAGFDVAIFSSRSKSLRGRRAMKRWLGRSIADHWLEGEHFISGVEAVSWGEVAEVVHRFSWPWLKPSAMVAIDDRALTFNGCWADFTPEKIRAFRPWNKQ